MALVPTKMVICPALASTTWAKTSEPSRVGVSGLAESAKGAAPALPMALKIPAPPAASTPAEAAPREALRRNWRRFISGMNCSLLGMGQRMGTDDEVHQKNARPTTGWLSRMPPVDPQKAESPKLKIPPSAADSVYPLPKKVPAVPSMG